jgi:hypothetical protein
VSVNRLVRESKGLTMAVESDRFVAHDECWIKMY